MLALILSPCVKRLEALQKQASEAGARVNCLDSMHTAHAIMRRYPDQIDLLVIDIYALSREALSGLLGLRGARSHARVVLVSDRHPPLKTGAQVELCKAGELASTIRASGVKSNTSLRMA